MSLSNYDETSPSLSYNRTNWSALMEFKPRPWLVEGVIPDSGVAVIFGQSNSGKTFLTLDLLMHVCDGRPWFGRAVEQRSAIYFGLEGVGHFPMRVQAFAMGKFVGGEFEGDDNTMENLDTHFCPVLGQQVGLTAEHADAIVELAQREGLKRPVVVIDTLAASLNGDENDNGLMSDALRHAGELSRRLDSVVLLIHHPAKGNPNDLRGASSLRGAADTVIQVSKAAGAHSWRVDKSRDGETDLAEAFQLVPVELKGGATSCFVRWDQTAKPAVETPALKLGKWQGLVLEAIKEAGKPLGVDQLIAALLRQEPGKTKKQATGAVSDAVEALQRRGLLTTSGSGLRSLSYSLPEWAHLPDSAGGVQVPSASGKEMPEMPETGKTRISSQPKAGR